MKKRIFLFFVVFIILFAFFYTEFFTSYVKIELSDDSGEFFKSTSALEKIYVFSEDTQKKYYYNDGLKMSGNEAGYGEYYVYIPFQSGDLLKIRYMKYNNWYKSKISVKINSKKKGNNLYLVVKAVLTETGRLQKEQNTVNKEFLINGKVHEFDLEK